MFIFSHQEKRRRQKVYAGFHLGISYIGIVHVREINAETLTKYLLAFLNNKGYLPPQTKLIISGLGFDETNSISGEKSLGHFVQFSLCCFVCYDL